MFREGFTVKKKARKPAKKSATKSGSKRRGSGRPFKKGYDARRGKGPPKGQGGRPPDRFKLPLGEYTDKQVEKIGKYLDAHGPNDPDWWRCLEFAAKYSKRRAEMEPDEGGQLPYVVIAPGPPAGIVKE